MGVPCVSGGSRLMLSGMPAGGVLSGPPSLARLFERQRSAKGLTPGTALPPSGLAGEDAGAPFVARGPQ